MQAAPPGWPDDLTVTEPTALVTVDGVAEPEESDGGVPVAFMGGTHFHAVWDRTGATFGATHTDILTKLDAMNVRMVRIDTSWSIWEPTPGSFDDDPYGGKLSGSIQWCHDNGIRVLMTVNEAPGWACGEPATPMLRRLPTSPATMEGIAGFIAGWLSQWGSTIAGVEVWNEPNLTGFDDLGPRPDHYFDCLKVFYDTVKAGPHPDVPVVFGATEAMSVSATPAAPTDLRNHFITYCYDRKEVLGLTYFPWDVMATHSYPGSDAPAVPSTGTQFWRVRHFEYVEALMQIRGDLAPVFITELGYSAHSNSQIEAEPQPGFQTGVTDAEQATLTAEAVRLIRDSYPRVKAVVVYNDWEKGISATSYVDRHQFGFGILRFADRATTKPIYTALQDMYGSIE